MTRTRRCLPGLCVALLMAGAATGLAQAATLRIASAFDPQTMDPHAVALLYHTRVVHQIHESLVNRDAQFKLEPALAQSWAMSSPTRWRFKLRPGVKFHDGAAFTADDVVFSIARALGPSSQRSFTLKGISAVNKVDALTVDFVLSTPDAVLPDKLSNVPMVSQAWCVQHGVEKAQDFNAKQETFTVRNANGTGPFKLLRYEPDVRVQLLRFDGWWGRGDARTGNLDAISFVPIKSDATRLAALTSGEVDLVLDPPFQDVERLKTDAKLSVATTTDLGTQYLTFDQARDELLHSDVKGAKVPCDTGQTEAVTREIGESAATVVRSLAAKGSITPQLTLYGLSPVVQTAGRGKLVVERLDVKGERYNVDLTPTSVVRGKFYDFAKTGTALKPGGMYAASLGTRSIIFRVDPRAQGGATPIIGRLVRLE